MTEKDVVLNTADEAAKLMTVTGWVSRHGRFYGQDERTARYDGCTHVVCECGKPTEKSWTHCAECREKRSHERWLALPLVEWDGITPLCLHDDDQYFFDVDSIHEHAEEHEIPVSSLRLVVCEPNLAREVDPDYWTDELVEDGELPDWLEKALELLNRTIRINRGDPLSWSAGKQRVILEDQT